MVHPIAEAYILLDTHIESSDISHGLLPGSIASLACNESKRILLNVGVSAELEECPW
jgi:hypothetical protein